MSYQDHADAMLDLLRADPWLVVFPEENGGPELVPPGTDPPFVSVHFSRDQPLGGRLTHQSTRTRLRAYAHCVGLTEAAARIVCDRVSAAWLDVIPAVPGRVCYPIRSDPAAEPNTDESTGALMVTITEVYRLESDLGSSGS